jgi:hypothetical protein
MCKKKIAPWLPWQWPPFWIVSTPQKLPHTTVDIPTKLHEVWWKESKKNWNPPFFVSMASCRHKNRTSLKVVLFVFKIFKMAANIQILKIVINSKNRFQWKWIFTGSKTWKKLKSPFFVSMASCRKVYQTDSDLFGLSRSTRCGCCSYQVSSISVWRVTCYDHFCVFHFF